LPVNIGNDREFTMLECAEIVLSITGSKSKVIAQPLPPERTDDPMQRKPDLTKARKLLNWEPKVDFREGLQRSLQYFQSCVADVVSR